MKVEGLQRCTVHVIMCYTWCFFQQEFYRVGAPPPGFFRLFAIGELVGDKPARSGPAFWRLSDDVANVETGPGGR